MSEVVNIHEAKTQLSKLLARVVQGEEIIIARSGRPIAKLVAVHVDHARRPGRYASQGYIAEDFDAPLREVDDSFYQ
jgi:prevent-host-death family protein